MLSWEPCFRFVQLWVLAAGLSWRPRFAVLGWAALGFPPCFPSFGDPRLWRLKLPASAVQGEERHTTSMCSILEGFRFRTRIIAFTVCLPCCIVGVCGFLFAAWPWTTTGDRVHVLKPQKFNRCVCSGVLELRAASSIGSWCRRPRASVSETIGAVIIRIGFWGISCYNSDKEPPQ